MPYLIALTIYRLLFPLVFLAAFPGWIVKMIRRGGIGTSPSERLAIYPTEDEFEPCGQVHFHAVSVGESLLALKLIREWKEREPDRQFLLATGTATGHAVATTAGIQGLRVTYAPLDFPWMIRRYLERFEPSQIVLVEGEVWPHLLFECEKRKIPIRLVNARMSPRSARRFRKFSKPLRPIYQLLDAVAIQEKDDAEIWETLGIKPDRIINTGSLKFDPGSGQHPQKHAGYQSRLDAFGQGRPIIVAASTHPGEEVWIANAIRNAAPEALPVLVPRHAERRAEVHAELSREGYHVVLNSTFPKMNSIDHSNSVFVIDSTGELRDWTAHADVVIIGKSFLSTGGQNPCEAIQASKPVILGPHMENFQPLARRLISSGGCLTASSQAELSAAVLAALDPAKAEILTLTAASILKQHDGATLRILSLLMTGKSSVI